MSTIKKDFSLPEDNHGDNLRDNLRGKHVENHVDGHFNDHNHESNFLYQIPGDAPGDLEKPAIFDDNGKYHIFNAGHDYRLTLGKLEQTGGVIVEGSYSTAIAFYSWLKKRISLEYPVTDYISSRVARGVLYEKTGKILIRVRNHLIGLDKSPEIPWLRTFYPGNSSFLISLPDVLGMNGAWQWYKNGVRYKVLEHSLHPYYGVYFPTRTGHLEMFDKWLSLNSYRYSGAVDIGTGCGVLSFIMSKHGINKIHATDINPNAVYGTRNEVTRLDMNGRIDIEKASFFGSVKKTGDLTVFNPPWIPGEISNTIDRGMYYESGFFDNFFRQAGSTMAADSTLAILFSSYAIEAGITEKNPVEQELLNNDTFLLEEKLTAKITERSSKASKSWINRLRNREVTELWILKRA